MLTDRPIDKNKDFIPDEVIEVFDNFDSYEDPYRELERVINKIDPFDNYIH
jgi:hypothetical protein